MICAETTEISGRRAHLTDTSVSPAVANMIDDHAVFNGIKKLFWHDMERRDDPFHSIHGSSRVQRLYDVQNAPNEPK